MTETLPFTPRGPREEIVQGTVQEVRYASPDGRFAVLRIERESDAESVVVIGDIAGLAAGEQARFRGRWEEHAVYGKRLRAEGYTPVLPTSRDGITRFLGSGAVPGVGAALAQRLVSRFGDRTLDVIATQSARLREVPGIGKKRAEAIADAVRIRRADAESLSFLHALGLGPALGRKLLRKYGARTVQVLRDDPYLAAEEVSGIGFRTADRIGQAVGIGPSDPRRAAGAVLHLVAQAADEGHVYLPANEIEVRAERLEVPVELIAPAILELTARGMLERDADRVYAPPLHAAEVAVAERLRALARPRVGRTGREIPIDTALSEEQRGAVQSSIAAGLMVLTGGPGTGKTTTVRAIVRAHEALELRVTLCAPTGRAAKRMSETTEREAKTIHRLLEWSPVTQTFLRTSSSPLETDLVLVDEASMLDLPLSRALLEAVPPSASVVLVGDVDQLPPVGPGQVLRELIRSAQCPVVRLQHVFRQAQLSAIVRGAHSILRGEVPTPTPTGERGPGDLFFVRARDREAVLDRLLATLRRIPTSYALDPRRDVQILVPMRKGPIGTQRLNEALQAELNPAHGAPTALRSGDKVMQLRNDYEREVFNGDVGWVRRVEDGITYVEFEGGLRSYDTDELDALSLAYATTIHKSQGSEFPAVVVVLHSAHHVLLSRALLYTAVTRAKRLVVIVGEERAVARAAATVGSGQSFCALADRLRPGYSAADERA